MNHLYIIAGCNGAGKTCLSQHILQRVLQLSEFLNADAIAAALSPYNPDNVAFEAGKIMLKRINHLIENQVDFAFETTLSAKSYVHIIQKAKANNYQIHLRFLWLPKVDMAIDRVAKRVKQGGHNIPEPVIRRRYQRGLNNLFNLYIPLSDSLHIYDSSTKNLKLIAQQKLDALLEISSQSKFNRMQNNVSEASVEYQIQVDELTQRIIDVHFKALIEGAIRANESLLVADDDGNMIEESPEELRRQYEVEFGVPFEG